jgi:hypothetical protein
MSVNEHRDIGGARRNENPEQSSRRDGQKRRKRKRIVNGNLNPIDQPTHHLLIEFVDLLRRRLDHGARDRSDIVIVERERAPPHPIDHAGHDGDE